MEQDLLDRVTDRELAQVLERAKPKEQATLAQALVQLDLRMVDWDMVVEAWGYIRAF